MEADTSDIVKVFDCLNSVSAAIANLPVSEEDQNEDNQIEKYCFKATLAYCLSTLFF
jgi:hypothetical protein